MKPGPFEKQCMKLIDGYFRKITRGHLVLWLPDGRELHYGDDSEPRRINVNRYRFFTDLVLGGNIGLGEAWTAGDWESDELPAVLELFIDNMSSLRKSGVTAGWAKRFGHLVHHFLNRNTKTGSRRNIQAHYDLGNDFYQLFLDTQTMMYSAALFENRSETLEEAQLNKIHRLTDLADIRPDHHVLEIGCGWGGFAVETAKQTGCRITGITLSDEQYRFAKERVESEGLAGQVDILLCDYRDVQGVFDRIVSIEMLEAVGHKYDGTFFNTCDRLLKPGGSAVLQVITIPDQRYDAYRRNPDWIQKHIFPGGMLPSVTALSKAMSSHSTLTIDHLENIGIHYAETLRRWRAAFDSHRDELIRLGYDDMFQRKWFYYLCYCESGFQTRFINDLHLRLIRPAECR